MQPGLELGKVTRGSRIKECDGFGDEIEVEVEDEVGDG